ncbi:MAG: glucose-1-phosphate adenylyltransferase [Ruminococcaceae bacterium]|nr:glucose-1-phosphate adenylyltransferase [Oscillospiraceae bacterium]
MLERRKECIAMLLAGGQGSRLLVLTEKTAKPAVPFGGKYRIIDFPLSNCVNSELDTVGILTQYQPLELNDYIGNGQPWGLNRNYGGAHVLPPYQTSGKTEWYKGTANAIYQNISFVEGYNPEHVIILSGDHIYKMDYNKMLKFHKDNNAECTIAVRDVPIEEASRFGIMNTNPDGSIYEFEEKPKKPKSNHASMGVYIFKWEVLKEYLIADEADETSSNDFGKNIIPALLRDGRKLFAYTFAGYWKDVGTISSLWEANMDILDGKFSLKDKYLKIYARNYAQPSSYIADCSKISNSFISEGCTVKGKITHSIISTGCIIEEDVEIIDSVIMPGAVIKKGSVIKYAIIGEDVTVERNCRIGDSPEYYDKDEWGISVIGKGETVSGNSVIKPGTVI